MSGFSRNDRETAAIRASPNQHRRKLLILGRRIITRKSWKLCERMDGIRGDWVRRFYSKNIYSYSLYSRFKNTFLLPFSCDASNQAKSFFRKISFVKSSRKTFETLDSKAFNSYLSGNRGSSSFFQSYTLITREKRKTENNFREEYAKQ